MPVAALLEPHVVVGGDAGQQRELLAPEAGHAAAAEVGQADVLGPDELAPGAEEVADAVVGLHGIERSAPRAAEGGPATTRVAGALASGDVGGHGEAMTKTLEGRIAVVTGASSGIGAATAQRLAEAGAQVAVVARRAERLEALDRRPPHRRRHLRPGRRPARRRHRPRRARPRRPRRRERRRDARRALRERRRRRVGADAGRQPPRPAAHGPGVRRGPARRRGGGRPRRPRPRRLGREPPARSRTTPSTPRRRPASPTSRATCARSTARAACA